jgi:hypothetical protein
MLNAQAVMAPDIPTARLGACMHARSRRDDARARIRAKHPSEGGQIKAIGWASYS